MNKITTNSREIGLRSSSMLLRLLFIIVVLTTLMITTACSSTNNSGRPFIEYTRSGGLLRFDDHLVIEETGDALLDRKVNDYQFSLSDADRQALIDLVEQLAGQNFQSRYSASQSGADLMTYTLIIRGQRIQMEDTAIPDELTPLIDQLNQIIDSYGT